MLARLRRSQTVPKLPVSKSKRRRTAEKLQQEDRKESVSAVPCARWRSCGGSNTKNTRPWRPYRGVMSQVVNLRETFEDKNFFYMVMELCEGGELVPLA